MNKNTNSLSSIRPLVRATRGANMVEYIILVGVVALLAVVGFKAFSGNVKDTITTQGTTVAGAAQNGAGTLGP